VIEWRKIEITPYPYVFTEVGEMVAVEEFKKYLDMHNGIYRWEEGEYNGKKGLFVENLQFNTTTHFTYEAIEKNDLATLLNATHHGKNVEQITRVTGFFSKVKNWNRGKLGELRDRHRVSLDT